MRKFYSFLLLTVMMVLGSITALAAGYTRTLSDNVTVTGYVYKAFYNFQTNESDVLPTSGDLRYRDGNIWGLHNFGSGGRSAVVSIPVSKDDLIILQDYNGTATVTGCSANSTASATTGYLCFDVTADAETITISTPRYGGVVAALVMSKDQNVSNANYTVKCVCIEEELKSDEINGVVGEVPVITKNAIWKDDQKYVYVNDDLGDKTIAADGSTVVTLQYRLAETYSYIIASNVEGVNYSGSAFEGETVTVAVPRYILKEGTLYETAKNGNDWYHHSFVMSEDINETITYNLAANGVVFYSEAEDLEGVTSGNGNGSRTSMGLTGYGTDLPVTTLPAGSYKIYMHGANGNSAARAVAFKNGETPVVEFSIAGANNNQDFVSEVFTLSESADITLTSEGSQASGVDYFYIQQVTPATMAVNATAQYGTFCAPFDVEVPEGVEASIATLNGDVIELASVGTTIPANTPVILFAEAGLAQTTFYGVAVSQTGAPEAGVLTGVYVDSPAPSGSYVLQLQGEKVGFYHVEGVQPTVGANRAFLTAPASANARAFFFDVETAISAVEALASGKATIYNANGVKINSLQKGINIVNGKKIMVK